MKAIIVYASKTGFVKKYAHWIADELSASMVRLEDVKIEYIMEFDTLIFGGGLYAGGINGIKFIKNNLDKLEGKKIALFATGASPGRKEEIDEVWNRNFTKDEQKKIGLFYLRGGFDHDKLGVKDKVLMTLLKKKLESKKELTADEEGMLAAYDEPVDFTNRENIKELLEFIRDS